MSPITKIILAKAQKHPFFLFLFFYATPTHKHIASLHNVSFIQWKYLSSAFENCTMHTYYFKYLCMLLIIFFFFCFRFVNALVNARLLYFKIAIEYSLKVTKIIYLSNRPFKLKSWSEILQKKKNIENSKVCLIIFFMLNF